MRQRVEQQGTSFVTALRAAVAELIDADADEVRIELPELDDDGPVRVQIALEILDEAEETREQPVDAVEAGDEPTDETPLVGTADAAEEEVPPARATVDRSAPPEAQTEGSGGWVTEDDLDAEADAAADFLEGLLDALDLPGDLRIHLHADHVEIELVDIGTGALIGRRGQTLEAIQELVRCVLQQEFQRRSRVKIDAEGYRARRLEKLLEKADEVIDNVLETGEAERLEPMDVFERKAVHHLVAQVEGVDSRSQGREPARRIIIEPVD